MRLHIGTEALQKKNGKPVKNGHVEYRAFFQ